MPKVYADINSAMLRWARDSSGMELGDAAKSLHIKPEKLSEYEEGKPVTVPFLHRLADLYKRPLAVFYLPETPQFSDPLPDFRRHPASEGNPLSPKARLQIRRIQEKQRTAQELLSRTEPFDWTFVGSVRVDTTSAETVGEQARGALRLSATKWKDDYSALNEWRSALENMGLLTFQVAAADEFSGFSLASEKPPCIVLNRREAPKRRIFTLMHEFFHILLGQSGLCDVTELSNHENSPAARVVEGFCNHAAGSALVPLKALLAHEIVSRHGGDASWEEYELSALSDEFRVSQEVILRRILIAGKTSNNFYNSWKIARANERIAAKKIEGFGESAPARVLRTQGQSYVRLVLDALQNNEITAVRASDYLDIKTQYIGELEKIVQS